MFLSLLFVWAPRQKLRKLEQKQSRQTCVCVATLNREIISFSYFNVGGGSVILYTAAQPGEGGGEDIKLFVTRDK